jgi:hypothetical protein
MLSSTLDSIVHGVAGASKARAQADADVSRYGIALPMRCVLLLVTPLVALVLVLGCGSAKKGSGQGDAGDTGDTGSPGNGPPANGPGGIVTVQESVDVNCGAPTYNGTVSASFSETAAVVADPSCTVSTAGDCQIQICDGGDAGASAPPGPLSAGTIAVSGTASPVSLTPDPDGTYEPYTSSSTGAPFIPPSGTIQVTASGGAVPAFQASVAFGGALTLTSPQISGISTTLPSGDVPFTWTGGSTGDHLQVFLSANAAADPTKTASVTCVFSGGSGTVPASAMATMSNLGSLGAGPLSTTSVTAGSFDVVVKAQVINLVAVFTK